MTRLQQRELDNQKRSASLFGLDRSQGHTFKKHDAGGKYEDDISGGYVHNDTTNDTTDNAM